jgi:hypothetical protein
VSPFTIIDVPQRSPEWFAARAGRLTASCAKHLLSKGKGSAEAVGRRDTRDRLVVERLTGRPVDTGNGFQNDAMEWGEDTEAEARLRFESLTGELVTQVGFLAHTELMAGGSPDGVIGDFAGLLEIKCPTISTHMRYVRGPKEVPADHLPQLLHMLWLTQCDYIDFFSFDPRFPAHLQTFLVRLKREAVETDLKAYEILVRNFLGECDRDIAALAAEQAAA